MLSHLSERDAEDESRVNGYGPMVVYAVICLNRSSLECRRIVRIPQFKGRSFPKDPAPTVRGGFTFLLCSEDHEQKPNDQKDI